MAVFSQIGLMRNETPYSQGMNPAVVARADPGLCGRKADCHRRLREPARGQNDQRLDYSTDVGTYGYNYLARAAIAQGGLAANLPADAVYPKAQSDSDGQPLSGANRYVMHFDKGNLPPVDAFWSLTLYNATTYMLVPNAIDRYAIRDRTPGLTYNPDGSLDIYIQRHALRRKGVELAASSGRGLLPDFEDVPAPAGSAEWHVPDTAGEAHKVHNGHDRHNGHHAAWSRMTWLLLVCIVYIVSIVLCRF